MGCLFAFLTVVFGVSMLYSLFLVFFHRPLWAGAWLVTIIILLAADQYRSQRVVRISLSRTWPERIINLMFTLLSLSLLAAGTGYTSRIGLSGDHRLLIYVILIIGIAAGIWNGIKETQSSRSWGE